jgi:hypothetical protein
MIALLALLAAITTPYTPASYGCNGVTATFSVTFPYQAQADLVVTSTTGVGAVTTLALTTDYTLNVTSTTTTATLTLTAPASSCPNGNTLKITRATALTQPTSFKSQLNFNPALHEMVYDRLEMQIQQLNAGVITITQISGVLPVANGGTGVSSLSCSGGQPVTSSGIFSCLGTTSQAFGGTGAGALTCTATQVLTSNGTVYSCTTPPGIGSTGSAVPSTAQYQGGKDSSGNLLGVRICDKTLAIAQVALNGSAQIIAGVSSTKIYVCGGFIVSSAAVSVKFIEGTGSNCVTGSADVTGAAALAISGGYSLGLNAFAVPFSSTAADALCVNTSGAATLGGWLSYTQQ